jgi:hypothetical protein
MIRRDALSEYVRGSLWVLPTLSVLAALAAGSLLSLVSIGPRSPLAFQGTSDDARALLIGIAGTMVTVIALLLGLTVVALQLSSTQYSPRLLRIFSGTGRIRSCSAPSWPSLPTVRPGCTRSAFRAATASTWWPAPRWHGSGAPHGAIPPPTHRPSYSPGRWGPDWVRAHPGARCRTRHQAAGGRRVQSTVPGGQRSLHRGPGGRSPLGDLLRSLHAPAGKPRRPGRQRGCGNRPGAAVPGLPRRDMRLIRRYGAREPTVAHALLRLLGNCAAVAGHDPERGAAIEEQTRIVIADAEREVVQPADLAFAHAEAESVRQAVAAHQPMPDSPAGRGLTRLGLEAVAHAGFGVQEAGVGGSCSSLWRSWAMYWRR